MSYLLIPFVSTAGVLFRDADELCCVGVVIPARCGVAGLLTLEGDNGCEWVGVVISELMLCRADKLESRPTDDVSGPVDPAACCSRIDDGEIGAVAFTAGL